MSLVMAEWPGRACERVLPLPFPDTLAKKDGRKSISRSRNGDDGIEMPGAEDIFIVAVAQLGTALAGSTGASHQQGGWNVAFPIILRCGC